MANNALIRYYARLIQKGNFEEKDLPSDVHDEVMELMKTLPPIARDPVTQTPEKTE